MSSLFYIVVYLGTAVIFISSCVCIYARRFLRKTSKLEFFYIYPLIILLQSGTACLYVIYSPYSPRVAITIEKFFFTIDLFFWIFFYHLIINNKSKLMQFFLVCNSVLFVLLISVINLLESSAYFGVGISNIGKCLFCLAYFYDLLKSTPTRILRNEPVFLISLGLFFSAALNAPIFITIAYLATITDKLLTLCLFSITNLSVIVMHLFFIKAQLCVRQLHRT